MSKHSKLSGMAIATAMATMIISTAGCGPKNSNINEGTIKCSGINSCKGKSACGTSSNACNGLNSCKGQGWLLKNSEQECTDAGGKVIS